MTYLTKLQECYVVKENGVENVSKHQNYHLLLKIMFISGVLVVSDTSRVLELSDRYAFYLCPFQ